MYPLRIHELPPFSILLYDDFSLSSFDFVSELCLEHYCNNGHLGDIFTKVSGDDGFENRVEQQENVENFPSA